MMKKIIFTVLFFLILPTFAFATEFVVEVDTGGESINALEGKINVPTWLTIENILLGDSAVLIWIEEPYFDEKSSTISFSGISPGGFLGKKPIFIFFGHFDQADIGGFSFSGTRALKNDGSGTAVPVTFSISKTEVPRDQEPPGDFKITLASSEEIFEGRKFITFLTQDNGTGVKSYEYAPTWFLPPRDGNWLETESPTVLSREMLFQKIYVRAVDNSGNYKVASIAGPYHYASFFLGIIILLCIFLFLRRLASRRYSYFSSHP